MAPAREALEESACPAAREIERPWQPLKRRCTKEEDWIRRPVRALRRIISLWVCIYIEWSVSVFLVLNCIGGGITLNWSCRMTPSRAPIASLTSLAVDLFFLRVS